MNKDCLRMKPPYYLSVIFLFNFSAFAAPELTLSIVDPSSPPEIALNFSFPNQPNFLRCSDFDFPDNRPRAMIGPDGNVWMWANNSAAYRKRGYKGGFFKFGGTSLNEPFAGGACLPAFVYLSNDPTDENETESAASYNNRLWLAEFQVSKNPYYRIDAILHNEFHGESLTDCMSHDEKDCWYSNNIAGVWDNTVQQFKLIYQANNRTTPVFVSPYRYKPGIGRQGFGSRTNIILNPGDGYYYILVGDNTIPGAPDTGMCLFRTRNVKDPSSWRAWDGNKQHPNEGFTIANNLNPYYDRPDLTRCKHVLPLQYRFTITYNLQYKTFIAIGVQTGEEENIVYATTQDLTDWGWTEGMRRNFGHSLYFPNFAWMSHWTASTVGNSIDAQGYFSLLDPNSPHLSQKYLGIPDYNFQFSGGHPYLYFVLFHAKDLSLAFPNSSRDVARYELNVMCTSDCEVDKKVM
jgi:hypothetical protein